MHVKNFNDPIICPRQETDISYSRPNDFEWRYRAVKFEGLSRTLLVAAALIKNKPEAIVDGYAIRDYYAEQILSARNKDSECYVGTLEDIVLEAGHEGPFQHTVECAALAIALMETKEFMWDRYTKKNQDLIAGFM